MKKLLLTGLFTLLFPIVSYGANATLTWKANTESDLAGYKIYWGIGASGVYENVVDVGNVTTYTITSLEENDTIYAAATAYDTSGNESGYSTEASKRIDTTAPAKPGDIVITITIVR